MFRDNVINMGYNGNIVVVRTLAAAAQSVSACLDGLGWKEILGTVGGDDTIFIMVNQGTQPREVIEKLQDLMD
ncbi:MAG: arginine repressor, partial [Clostridiales bacterium]